MTEVTNMAYFVCKYFVDHYGKPEGKYQVAKACFENIYVLWYKWFGGRDRDKGDKKVRVGGSCW